MNLTKDGQHIGSIEITDINKDDKQYIYISDLEIKKEFKNMDNLLFLRDFIKERYPNATFVYWWSEKKQKYIYCK